MTTMTTQQPLSHWARPRAKCTDHWSKLKSKSSYFHTLTPTGNYICYCRPQQYDPQGKKYGRKPSELLKSFLPHTRAYSHHFQPDRHLVHRPKEKVSVRHTLARIGSTDLGRDLVELGMLQLPTAQQWLTNHETERKRRSPSASSRRARRGFVYWPREQTEYSPTSKKAFGSKDTFLGI